MNTAVTAIYRYPVKGLSAEKMDRVALLPGECLPHDRRFAIALASTAFDPKYPEWLSKIHFAMLMRDEKLAQLNTRFDAESRILAISRDGQILLRSQITEPEGRCQIAQFFTDFLSKTVSGPLRIVSAPGHAFADARRKPNAATDKYVSLINLASVAALEAVCAHPSIHFDFAPISISMAHKPGASSTGPARRSASGPRNSGCSHQSRDALRRRSIRLPQNATSTSSPPSGVPSATSIWAFMPRW